MVAIPYEAKDLVEPDVPVPANLNVIVEVILIILLDVLYIVIASPAE